MLTDDELQAIRVRCEAATPGPWLYIRRMDGSGLISMGDNVKGPHVQADFDFGAPNGSFVSAARTDVPDLLKHAEHQRRAISWLATALGNISLGISPSEYFPDDANMPHPRRHQGNRQ